MYNIISTIYGIFSVQNKIIQGTVCLRLFFKLDPCANEQF